jgi:hypothetical protein
MSTTVQSWIRQAAAARGVLACGFRKADRSVVVKSSSPDFSNANMEKSMSKLFEAAQALQHNQIPTDRVRWAFETVQLHCAAALGGEMAVLLATRENVDSTELERLLAEAPLTPN